MKFSGFNLIPLCIPVYASYPPLPVAHARLGYHCHAIGFVGRLHANSDRVQLAERTPAFLTPPRFNGCGTLFLAVVEDRSSAPAAERRLVFDFRSFWRGMSWLFLLICLTLLPAADGRSPGRGR